MKKEATKIKKSLGSELLDAQGVRRLDIRKLNLGCDFDYKEGWINLDQYPGRADIVHDLDKFPYPFKKDTFDYILASHVIEHLNNIIKVMKELWRISKPDAIIEIKVPYYKSFNAFRDITHKHQFTWDSFSTFVGKLSLREKKEVGYIPVLFEYVDRKLIWASSNKLFIKQLCKLNNKIININPEFFERYCPIFFDIFNPEALHVKLRVKK